MNFRLIYAFHGLRDQQAVVSMFVAVKSGRFFTISPALAIEEVVG